MHVARNSVDHGIEAAEQRIASGKPPGGRIELTSGYDGDTLVIAVSDDGAGIDWAQIRGKAEACGLPHTTHEDLVAALFHDGLSSRDEGTEMSGRGVGLAAVMDAARARGGEVVVRSEQGAGTTVEFRFAPEGIPGLSLVAPTRTGNVGS